MNCLLCIEMIVFRLICPNCGTKIITATREEATWELCPGCFKHVWDLLDSRMAEPVTEQADRYVSAKPQSMASN